MDTDDLKPFLCKYKSALSLRFDGVLEDERSDINDDQALQITNFLEKHRDE